MRRRAKRTQWVTITREQQEIRNKRIVKCYSYIPNKSLVANMFGLSRPRIVQIIKADLQNQRKLKTEGVKNV